MINNKIQKGKNPGIHLHLKSPQILIQIDQINSYLADQITKSKMECQKIYITEDLLIIILIEVKVRTEKCKN